MVPRGRSLDDRLVEWMFDIYRDQAREFGDGLLRDTPQLEALIAGAPRGDGGNIPDIAPARVRVASLLYDLLVERKNIPGNAGIAWALAETCLLLHGLTVTASDDLVYDLIVAIGEGRLSRARAAVRLSVRPVGEAW